MKPTTLISYLDEFPKRGKATAFFFRTPFRKFALSYEELHVKIHKITSAFENLGLKEGDRVLFWGINSPDWAASYLACLLKKLIAVPMDVRGSAAFTEKIYGFTEASIVLCDRVKEKELQGVRPLSFETLSAEAGRLEFREVSPPAVRPSDSAVILFTSGTTGQPKGVVLTHENIVTNVEALNASVPGFGEKDRCLSLLPLSHIFEQTAGFWLPLRRRIPITYLQTLKASFILKSLEEDGITISAVVPRVLRLIQGGILREVKRAGREKAFQGLLAFSDFVPCRCRRLLFPALAKKFGGLKYFVSGGATLEPELERFWERLGIGILQGYGLSETSPVISCNFPQARRFGSIGKVVPGVEIRLTEDKEIWVRGASVFRGYYKSQELTREAFAGEWFKTGDLGELDRDGFLWFKGRKKEMIATEEGLKVYPQDIEAELHKIPGVKESCVFGLDRDGRQVIHAVLLLEDRALDTKRVIERANALLSDHQKIQSASVWADDDFPRTSTMKVRKNEVIATLRGEKVPRAELSGTEKDAPRLYAMVSALSGVKPESMTASSRLGNELGLASLDRMELAAMIEEEYGLALGDELLAPETSLGEIEKMIEAGKVPRWEKNIPRWPVHPWMLALRAPIQNTVMFPLLRHYCRIKTEGAGNLEGLKGPAIFVSNHESYFDGPAILAALPPEIRERTAIAAWKEFFEPETGSFFFRSFRRFFFYVCAAVADIYVFPQTRGFRKSYEHTGWLIDAGFNILIFPEGERSLTGEMLPFRPGIDRMVRTMKIPVVPVRLKGLYEIFPRHKKFPARGKVVCRFGKPVVFDSETNIDIGQAIQNEVRRLGHE